jgi:hypothetical protein
MTDYNSLSCQGLDRCFCIHRRFATGVPSDCDMAKRMSCDPFLPLDERDGNHAQVHVSVRGHHHLATHRAGFHRE